jgi:hypothetical protein
LCDLELRQRTVQLVGAVDNLADQRLAAALPHTPARQAGGGGEHGGVECDRSGVRSEHRADGGGDQDRRKRRPHEHRAEAAAGQILGVGSLPHTFEVTPPFGHFHCL